MRGGRSQVSLLCSLQSFELFLSQQIDSSVLCQASSLQFQYSPLHQQYTKNTLGVPSIIIITTIISITIIGIIAIAQHHDYDPP